MSKLKALQCEKLTKKGRYSDGAGLYLQVQAAEQKSWLFRYTFNSKAREMGLGRYPEISLANAREKVLHHRKILKDPDNPRDPLAVREELKRQALIAEQRKLLFKDAADACINNKRIAWSNPKSEAQWRSSLETYAFPIIGQTPVNEIDRPAICSVLDPIWHDKTETASRIQQRIETILDYAKATGVEMPENPARWKGQLDQIYPKRTQVKQKQHHPALPVDQVPSFFEALQAANGTAPQALMFTILTGTRTSECIEATWDEIDLTKAEWTIPKERMKAKNPHNVPLSKSAVAILETMKALGSKYVFPTPSGTKHMSNGAMLALVKRLHAAKLGKDNLGWVDRQGKRITPHGFRSTFRDWAGEFTNFPREVIEHALSHKVGDAAEQAYARGTLFVKRKELMEAWGEYCC